MIVLIGVQFLMILHHAQSQCPAETVTRSARYRMWRENNLVSQENAKLSCLTQHTADLAEIKTDELANLSESLIRGCGTIFYIGLTRFSSSETWIWNDGTALTPEQERWQTGEPGNEDCVVTNSSINTWKDVPCSNLVGFLCQREILSASAVSELFEIAGETVEISIFVISVEGPGDLAVYKLPNESEKVRLWPNVTNGETIVYRIENADKDDSAVYKFELSESGYSTATYTNLTISVPVFIVDAGEENVTSPVTRGPSSIVCSASGSPLPDTSWTKDGEQISTTQDDAGVYQVIVNRNTAELYFENATKSDDGQYLCESKNVVRGKNGEEERTATKEINLSVFGSPTIQNIKIENCTSNTDVTVFWAADNQTLNINHTIAYKKTTNEGMMGSQIDAATSNAPVYTTLDGLDPYIEYYISVTVCPDDCIGKLSDQKVIKTGIGIPNEVTNASVKKVLSEGYEICRVEWQWNNVYPLDIMTFRVQTTRRIRQSRVPSEQFFNSSTEGLFFDLKVKPNSNYIFQVYAVSCAGESSEVGADGQCITDVEATDDVNLSPQVPDSGNGDTLTITIDIPDESNGPISCLFVILKPDGGNVTEATLTSLTTFSSAAFDATSTDEYMAVAIPMYDVYTEEFLDVELGNARQTSCDVYQISDTRSSSANEKASNSLEALNKALEVRDYSVYVVYTTPNDGTILTAQSDYSSFSFMIKNSYGLVIGLTTVGAALFIAFVVLLVYYFKSEQMQKSDPERELTYEPPKKLTHPGDSPPPNRLNGDGTKPTSATEVSMKNLLEKYEKFSKDQGLLFLQEFTDLKEANQEYQASYTVALEDQQKKKNRYKNVLPYDHSRVCLTSQDGTETNLYINASYIHGYERQQKFIATQGPLPSTVKDFWKMVLEQRSHIIVMVTNINDGGKKKCEHYWPDMSSSKVYGSVTVTNISEEYFGNYIKRIFEISNDQERTHSVVQYQFIDWPDHGVPISTSTFIRFYKACMKHQGQRREPIIVHCSAGAGRTGTFIAYDYLIHEAEDRHRVDPCQCVLKMREDRMDMVQACDQYRFIYRLVVEYHEFKDTDMDSETFYKRPPTESDIHEQFELLEKASRMPAIAKDKTFLSLNVPIMWRPGDGDEIAKFDANRVETYDDHFTLISSAPPTLEIAENFWRLILDNDIDIVVSINDSKAKQKTTGNECWPLEQNNGKRVGSISLELQNSEDKKHWEVRTVHVEREATLQTKKVRQYQVTKWTPSVALKVLEDLKISFPVGRRTQRPKVLVYSSNGFGSTGSFCALMNLIARLENERRVDVFRTVKDLRDCRKELVKDISHYKFCVNTLKRYGKTTHRISSQIEMHGQENEGYANFPTATSPV